MPHWPTSRHLPVVAAVAGLGVFAASPALAGVDRISSEGPLIRFAPVVPENATARVEAVYDTAGDSTVTLRVTGLRPSTAYGAHAHANSCGHEARGRRSGLPAGAEPGPGDARATGRTRTPGTRSGSTSPRTNRAKRPRRATIGWQFSPERRAGSVIIHAEHTTLGPRAAGTAGARLACLSVGF